MPERLNAHVDSLLFIKAKVDESFMIESNSVLHAFIEEGIRYCETRVPVANTNDNDVELNKLFKKSIV
jgi:hypothetical protein